MNIVIVGGGELGSAVAGELIREDHDVTVIEKSDKKAKFLNDSLDAFVITGSGTDIRILRHANVEKADLFLALSNDDNVNIVSCGLVKKLSSATTIAKVENVNHYFPGPPNTPEDFGIDRIVASKQLTINKIVDLIAEPDTIEHIHFLKENVRVFGIVVGEDFSGKDKKLKEVTQEDAIWNKIRVIAIKKGNIVRIPGGEDRLQVGDKLYIIGKSDTLHKLISLYFASHIKVRKVIINGGNRIGRELARLQEKNGKRVTIIEEDERECERLTEELDNVLIIKGSGTNPGVLAELDMEDAFVVCVTPDDEHNIISAVLAKKHKAFKAVCNISNIAISSIINQVKEIDSVFSTESLAVGEIMKYCRKGDILSVSPVPYIDAETVKIKISQELPILGKTLNEIEFPKGMIIGVIYRDGQVIIPHGEDRLLLGDVAIIFVLPESKRLIETIFA
ncbi:MAG: Trk system potassium transporter TrkA [Candidatus Marinimicrobia bacterium]|jgi:trk system potassium uptake protein TrkA|nr:Trk system potassium transporter TrkA [Candidatus Neomarinimicrobiota bacterium]MDD4961132.1 Trk system potassium transporter TrkA [Candidatus Neomarinimicrobiota bacterium]MDD5709332.1 Trk system potassium transporter TrkA [Candidatus Neomarinimicrobiota bacterium]MDX9777857.1 Trk system potassium transporter TrkA [bacterium]